MMEETYIIIMVDHVLSSKFKIEGNPDVFLYNLFMIIWDNTYFIVLNIRIFYIMF